MRRLLLLTLLGLTALALPAAGDDKRGLRPPARDAKAKATVAWSAPETWKELTPRQGEFAAWQLRRTIKAGTRREVTVEGPRLSLHFLGKASARRALEARRKAWARRFLDDERKRLSPEKATLEALEKAHPKLAISLVTVRGNYFAVLAPGQEQRPPLRGWVGVYAHVTGPDGVWVATLIGPAKDVEGWTKELRAFLLAAKPATVLRRPDPREGEGKGTPRPSDYELEDAEKEPEEPPAKEPSDDR